ncbi:ABC transporter permease [Glutamicibacter sp. JC586]|uniref:ABC transporter permease n=1 Tax=Glutamicibacter sp. JC586 TaxID=2590552 RepID=UPI00135CD785|nr:ABC transporter permease [Glutamicibacter sp. JC586]
MSLNLEPQHRAKKQQLKLALRISWRDIKRHRGRSTLIAALIAVPIMMISAALVAGFSKMPSTEETITNEFGQTAGRVSLQYSDLAGISQSPKGDLSSVISDADAESGQRNGTLDDFKDLVLPDYDVLPLSSISLTTEREHATLSFDAVIGDVLNPAFDGKYKLLEGRKATSNMEAFGTPGFMQRFDLQLGDRFSTNAGEFTMVGMVRDSNSNDSFPTFFAAANDLPENFVLGPNETKYYLLGQKPATWTLATELNQRGAILTSAELLRNPPPAEQVGASAKDFADAPSGNGLDLIMTGALIASLAMLEVGLLAGAAFAVGTRKQQQDLALLAATGAEAGTLKSVVSASGLWLGLIGGIAGTLAGTGVGIAWVLWKLHNGENLLWLHIPWPLMLGVVLLALIAGVLSAYGPARMVANQALNVALKSGRTTSNHSRKSLRRGIFWLALSLLLLALSASLSLFEIIHDFELRSYLALALVIMSSIGLISSLILLTAPLLRLVAAKSAWLPLPLRLATRDSARNTGRTVPAVAAVLAAATLSSAILIYWSSSSHTENDNYQWSYNLNQMALPLTVFEYSPSSIGAMGTASSDALTTRKINAEELSSAALKVLGDGTSAAAIQGAFDQNECAGLDPNSVEIDGIMHSPDCSTWALKEPVGHQCFVATDGKPIDLQDWRCRGSMANDSGSSSLPTIVVGGEETLETLLGRKASPEALQTLTSGGAVVSNPVYLNADETTTLISYDANAEPQESVDTAEQMSSLRTSFSPQHSFPLLATVEEPTKPIPYYAVISPETASRIGMPYDERLVLLSLNEVPSDAVNDTLLTALSEVAGENYGPEKLETGPNSNVTSALWLLVGVSALVTFSATGITAGLALADGREDHSVLASIGADPRLRKSLSAAQLFLTSVIGTLFGIVAGIVATGTLQLLFRDMALIIPWTQLTIMLLVVPCIGSVMAWLLTKGRLHVLRHRTLA